MKNIYFDPNDYDVDLLFVNAVVENLKYGIISLDTMFQRKIGKMFYGDRHTFYFFHMQSLLTAQGNIWNVFYNDFYKRNREISKERVLKMREKLGVDVSRFPLVGNKQFRNTNEHFDERFFEFEHGLGDYNILEKDTAISIRNQILKEPHLRTLDIENWIYYSYNKRGQRISMNLKQLREEMHQMLCAICGCEEIKQCNLRNPRKKLIYEGVVQNDQL